MAIQVKSYGRLSSSRSSSDCYKTLVIFQTVAMLVMFAKICGTSAARPDDTYMYASTSPSAGHGSKSAGVSGFVTTRGHQFYLNGKPLYMNGANMYWMMTVAADPSRRGIVDDMLRQAAGVGVTVIRAFAFADGTSYMPLQVSPGVYNEATFEGLDYVIAGAKKNGIRMLLSLTDNWGSKPQYVSWAHLSSEDQFYTSPTTRGWYKNQVKTVLNRVNKFTGVAYRNEPAIFAWELMNEPRCASDTSGNTLQAWIYEMAAFVKSLDRIHLLEVGMEGFYSGIVDSNSASSAERANPSSYASQLGTDFIRNNQVGGIDFASVHSYPDTWITSMSYGGKNAWMQTWVQTHIDDAANKLNKPVLFAEFGVSSWTSGYTESERFTDMSSVYNMVYQSARSGGAGAGALVWQLVTSAVASSLADGYQIVLSSSPSISNLMKQQTSRLSSL